LGDLPDDPDSGHHLACGLPDQPHGICRFTTSRVTGHGGLGSPIRKQFALLDAVPHLLNRSAQLRDGGGQLFRGLLLDVGTSGNVSRRAGNFDRRRRQLGRATGNLVALQPKVTENLPKVGVIGVECLRGDTQFVLGLNRNLSRKVALLDAIH